MRAFCILLCASRFPEQPVTWKRGRKIRGGFRQCVNYLPESSIRFILQGLGTTIFISVLCILCSMALGMVIAMGRSSRTSSCRGVAGIYIEVFRTPLLLWIMLIFLSSSFHHGASVLSFSLFTSASLAKLSAATFLRPLTRDSGRLAIPRALAPADVPLYPDSQAFRSMVPALLSQTVTTIKDTSYLWGAMASSGAHGPGMILMNQYNSTLQILHIFGTMALLYFVVCFALYCCQAIPAAAETGSLILTTKKPTLCWLFSVVIKAIFLPARRSF